MDNFWAAWKVSGGPGNFLESLEGFQIIWKVSEWSGKFPDNPKFLIIRKIFDYAESLQLVHLVSMIMSPQTGDDVTKTAHTPLTMRSNCNFMNFLSLICFFQLICCEKRFTHLFVAKTICAPYPETFLRVELSHPKSSYFLGLCDEPSSSLAVNIYLI